MKIACVLITHLPVKAEQRRRAGLRERPVIIVESYGSKQVVLDSSPKAVGITAGMPLQEALSRCKGAALLQADEPYYRTVFDGIVGQLAQKSPVVERAELGCAYVGLDGLRGYVRRRGQAHSLPTPGDVRRSQPPPRSGGRQVCGLRRRRYEP